MTGIQRLRSFIRSMTELVEEAHDEPLILQRGTAGLRELVAVDDWLPDAFAAPDPARYRQYLLHCDPLERFSVVSFVWGPGQATPVHDHTVWGLIGVLRGAETCRDYALDENGRLRAGDVHRFERGQVSAVSPRIGDIHAVANALDDRVSVSIHVYGANIGATRRHVFDPGTSAVREFVSGYSSDVVPNVWHRAAQPPAAG